MSLLRWCAAVVTSVFSAGAISSTVYSFNFSDDAAAAIFGRTHVPGTVTGLLYGLSENGTGMLPTAIQITSDVSFLGMTDKVIDSDNALWFWDATGFTAENGVITAASIGLNFLDPIIGGLQLRLNENNFYNGPGYNVLHWNGSSGPITGTGNQNGFAGTSYARVVPSAIPEPTSMALIGIGAIAGVLTWRREKAQTAAR